MATTPKITLNACFKKNDNVVFRKIADEFVLVPTSQEAVNLESIFSLNETGARIWELIDGRKTNPEIGRIISGEFNQEENAVRKDLEEFLLKLKELSFIVQI